MPCMSSLLARVRAHLHRSSSSVQAERFLPGDGPDIVTFADETPTLGGRAFRTAPEEVEAFLTAVTPDRHRWIVLREERRIVAVLAAAQGADPALPAPFVLLIPGDAEPRLVDGIIGAVAAENHPGGVLSIVTDRQRAQQEALARQGFITVRRFSRLHRGTADAGRPCSRRGDLRLLSGSEAIQEGLSDEIRRAHNIAFSDHWGPMRKGPGEWREYLDRPTFDPELTAVLVASSEEGGRIAAYALNTRYIDTAEGTRIESAHTDYLGVLPGYRGQDLAGTLLRELWRRARLAGLRTASLGTDVDNLYDAARIYRSLGYREVETAAAHFRAAEGQGIASRDGREVAATAQS